MRAPRVGRTALALCGLLAVAGCADSPGALPAPSSTALLRVERTTTTGPDYSGNTLPVLEGSTTTSTVPIAGGRVTVRGRVTGPSGPVVGATVHVERLVGDDVGVVDVTTGAGGRFVLQNILAGRLRVRAWRVPDLVQSTPQVVFANGEQELALKVASFTGVTFSWATAPSAPWLGQQATVGLRVGLRTVGDDGIGRVDPDVGQTLTLDVVGAFEPPPAELRTTDTNGESRWTLRCATLGPSTLTITLGSGETDTYEAPACVPEPTTTTVPPTLVVPPEPGATTTLG